MSPKIKVLRPVEDILVRRVPYSTVLLRLGPGLPVKYVWACKKFYVWPHKELAHSEKFYAKVCLQSI